MSAIHLRCKQGFPDPFQLELFMPRMSIDHGPEQVCRWGEQVIPVAPGPHHLRVWWNYVGQMNVGEAEVDVAPDQHVQVVYKKRWLIFLRGKLEVDPDRPSVDLPTNAAVAQESMPGQAQPHVTPGWYPDTTRRHELRWWDGGEWTPWVSTRGVISTDPL